MEFRSVNRERVSPHKCDQMNAKNTDMEGVGLPWRYYQSAIVKLRLDQYTSIIWQGSFNHPLILNMCMSNEHFLGQEI